MGVERVPAPHTMTMYGAFGAPRRLGTRVLIASRRSGRAALRYRLEVLGYRLTQEALNAVYQRFLTVADRKKEVFDEDLRAIMNDQVVHMPETFKLEHLAISSVSGETPRASGCGL